MWTPARVGGALVAAGLAWCAAVWGPADHWAAEVPRATVRAKKLQARGEAAAALALLDRRDGRRPGIDTRLVTGFAALGAGEVDRARDEFEAALRIHQHDPQAWLGLCLLGGEAADAACERAVDRGHVEPGCAQLLARTLQHLRAGRGAEAEADLAECGAIDPSDPVLTRVRARVERARDAREKAEERAAVAAREAAAGAGEGDGGESAASSDPGNPAVPTVAYASRDEVRDWLASAAEERRQTRRAELDRIRGLVGKGRGRAALRRLGKLDGEPGAEERLLTAQAQQALDRIELASTELVAVAPSLPAGSRLALEGCVLAADIEAHAQAELLCPLAPPSTEGLCSAGHALALSRMNREAWEGAEEALAPCLAMGWEDGQLWFDAALTAAARGDVSASIARLREAGRIDPGVLEDGALRDDPAFAAWRADPAAAAALAAIRDGRVP